MFDKILNFILTLLPFFRRRDAKELKEFGELITGQYGFLVEQLEKALKDYFGLSDRVKALHDEVLALRRQLAEALPHSCYDSTCPQRKAATGTAP